MKYDDLLNIPFKKFGRDKNGFDCYGVVMECCKRAGTPLRDLYGTLSVATNKINQIAKRVNQTGVIYKSDIDDMKKFIEEFLKEQGDLHSLLLKRKK